MPVAIFKGTQQREATNGYDKEEGDKSEGGLWGGWCVDECNMEWDEIEEVSQAKADLKLNLQQENTTAYMTFCYDLFYST